MDSTAVVIRGTHFEVGRALGALARPIMLSYWKQSSTWHALQKFKGGVLFHQLLLKADTLFPLVMAELRGMAEGLDLPFDDVFLWNCRGDLLHKTNDGCTTLLTRQSDGSILLAHNEDGDPYLKQGGHFWLVDVQVQVHVMSSSAKHEEDKRGGFVSFYYPGSIPGHTFALNRTGGLAHTVNNLRMKGKGCVRSPSADASSDVIGTPRMVLSRAMLDMPSVAAVAALLRAHPTEGGFHYFLCGTAGSDDGVAAVSIENTSYGCSVLPVDLCRAHANHTTHGKQVQVSLLRPCDTGGEIVSPSSASRQVQAETMLSSLDRCSDSAVSGQQLLQILSSNGSDAVLPWTETGIETETERGATVPVGTETFRSYPILRRCPKDEDEENTLATALYTVTLTPSDIDVGGMAMKLDVYDFADTPASVPHQCHVCSGPVLLSDCDVVTGTLPIYSCSL